MAEMTRRISFTLSEDMEEKMREAAWQKRQSVSEWLRDAIEAHLQVQRANTRKGN